jgi:hypothetical protein
MIVFHNKHDAFYLPGLFLEGSLVAFLFAVSLPFGALAEDVQPALSAPAAWADTIKFSGHLEGGVTFNPDVQTGGENFGSLFTDKANQPLLNQFMVTAERPIDPKAKEFDLGFKLQGMFGTDARFTHGFNEGDHLIDSRYQFDVVEANISMHLPVLAEGGIDVKVGQFSTPMGAEVIDASANPLYSHSYVFNFGLPFKNTGFLATAHISSMLDLYGGLDTGVNAWVGSTGHNNGQLKGQFGLGFNLLGGDLTVLGFSHIGAENPASLGLPSNALRYLNDITTTWKVNSDLTLITDINYIADDGLKAVGYGVAQYAVYNLNEHLSLVGRGEIWRDDGGAFVAVFPGHFDFINAERGLPATTITSGRATYGALTVGIGIKPGVPKAIKGFTIRPELRIDGALNGTKPFNSWKDDVSFTPAVDFVLPF